MKLSSLPHLLLLGSFLLPFLAFSQNFIEESRSGNKFRYDLKGGTTYSNPNNRFSPARIAKERSKGRGYCVKENKPWISYAILNQLAESPELFKAAHKIIVDSKPERSFFEHDPNFENASLCRVAFEITFSAGYYTYCYDENRRPTSKVNNLLFRGATNKDMIYQVHLDTVQNRIYVAEKQQGEIIEINQAYIGKVWFEPDPEDEYERPTPNPSIDLNCIEPVYFPPTAVIEPKESQGPPNSDMVFDGRLSYDTDEDSQSIQTYFWDFGDGSSSDLPNPTHSYAETGSYTVLLRVTDDEGDQDSTTAKVLIDKEAEAFKAPVAKIEKDKAAGALPLTVAFDGSTSFDQDEQGEEIVAYAWTIDGEEVSREAGFSFTFEEEKTYMIGLTVTDDEGDSAMASTEVSTYPVGGDCNCKVDSCWMMYYRIEVCGDRRDTLEKTPMRVMCPAPPQPKVSLICCNQEEDKRIELAGGTVFKRYRGQLSEYSLGATGQIRYRFKEAPKWAALVDLSVQPLRKAVPSDDRPFRWSDLRDSIDVATGLPLVWHRGTERATANLGIGAEYTPFKRLFIQGMIGSQAIFQTREASAPEKDPFNQYIGFDPQVFYGECRVGIRSTHLEIYFAYELSEENRPFTLIPANVQGGTFTPRTDKSYNAGVQILF